MKIIIPIGLLFVCTGAFAIDSATLSLMLSSASVRSALEGREIKNIKFDETNKATMWTYKAVFETTKEGPLDTPETAPCYLTVVLTTVDGVVGIESFEPSIATLCARSYIPGGR